MLTSTNPTGGPGAWASFDVGGTTGLNAISCPSTSFCAAVDDYGNVLTSTSPTGGAGAWSVANIDGSKRLYGISCPSASLCVAGDIDGNVLTSTNPTGGAGAWSSPVNIAGNNTLTSVSCPSASFCAAMDYGGNVRTSTNPTGGAGAWSGAKIDGLGRVWTISCLSASFCATADVAGNVATSTNPTGGAGAWSVANINGSGGLYAISCAAPLCVAVGYLGNAVVGTANAPAAPQITDTDPDSPANNNNPKVKGVMGSGSSTEVKIYKNATCAGAPAATGTVAGFTGAGITVNVADDTTTSLSARASNLGVDSGCSNSFKYTEHSTVYRAKITKVRVKGPAKVKRGKKATYKVKITNGGNATAKGVRLKVSGRGVSFNTSVGKIAAGKTKTLKLKIKFKKPGKIKSTFKVTSKNAGGKTVKKKITVKK